MFRTLLDITSDQHPVLFMILVIVAHNIGEKVHSMLLPNESYR